MDMFNTVILQSADVETISNQGTTKPGSSMNMIFVMLAVFAIMWIIMIRPQSKKQKEMQRMLASLEKGDKVVTSAGIRGLVDSTKDDVVVVKSGETKIEFNKSAIIAVLEKKNPLPEVESKSIFSTIANKFKKEKK